MKVLQDPGFTTRVTERIVQTKAFISTSIKYSVMSADLKKKSQPKSWGLYFTWWEVLGLETQETASISSNPEMWGLLLIKEVRERSQVIQCLQQRAGSLNIKWLLLIKENQIFQVKEFSTFLCMGRCKSLGLLKSFLLYAPQHLGLVSKVYTHWASFPQGSLWEVAIVWWLLDSRYSPVQAHWLTLEGCSCWLLWHPCLLIWQEIFHFSCPLSEKKELFDVHVRQLLKQILPFWKGFSQQICNILQKSGPALEN